MKPTLLFIFCVLLLLAITNCAPKGLITASYKGNTNTLLQQTRNIQHVLQVDDKLSISVWDHDNLSIGSVFSIYNSNESYGKWVLVDSSGYISLPQIGPFKARGLTCSQLRDSITVFYKQTLINPIVVVKVLNREITVLGEVKSPGNFLLEKESTNLAEILGKAEGVTDYADMRHLQLVRNDTSYLINLSETSGFYTLPVSSGDILCVPAKRNKNIKQNAPIIIPFASATTAFAVLFSVLTK